MTRTEFLAQAILAAIQGNPIPESVYLEQGQHRDSTIDRHASLIMTIARRATSAAYNNRLLTDIESEGK